MVTHDLKSAARGNRVLYLKDGVICGECDLGDDWKNSGGRNSRDGREEGRERHERLHAFLIEMGW
jgi:putative ABC transport system ATP-binding protein